MAEHSAKLPDGKILCLACTETSERAEAPRFKKPENLEKHCQKAHAKVFRVICGKCKNYFRTEADKDIHYACDHKGHNKGHN